MSKRIRGERPYTVRCAGRSARSRRRRARRSPARASTFDRAYSVCGSSGEVSSTTSADDMPYMMQDDENRNRRTPASRASSASRTDAVVIDLLRPALVEVADRIVAERGQVDHRVEPVRRRRRSRSRMSLRSLPATPARAGPACISRSSRCRGRPPRSPALHEVGRHDRADVSAVSGDQNALRRCVVMQWSPVCRSASRSAWTRPSRGALVETSTNGATGRLCRLPVRSSSPMNDVRVRSRWWSRCAWKSIPGLRLAAVAALVPVVGAVVDGVDRAAGRARAPHASARGSPRDPRRVMRAAVDASLVRDDDHAVASARAAGGAPRARPAATGTPQAADVLGPRRSLVEHAVAVEDDRRPPREERLGQRQALERAHAVVAVLGPVRRRARRARARTG